MSIVTREGRTHIDTVDEAFEVYSGEIVDWFFENAGVEMDDWGQVEPTLDNEGEIERLLRNLYEDLKDLENDGNNRV